MEFCFSNFHTSFSMSFDPHCFKIIFGIVRLIKMIIALYYLRKCAWCDSRDNISSRVPTSHQYTASFLFPGFWHTTHSLWGPGFFLAYKMSFCQTRHYIVWWMSIRQFAFCSKKSLNWKTIDQVFSLCYICILSSHSELRRSRACEIASYATYSLTSSQTNKNASAGL
jgi:hypothetical protein